MIIDDISLYAWVALAVAAATFPFLSPFRGRLVPGVGAAVLVLAAVCMAVSYTSTAAVVPLRVVALVAAAAAAVLFGLAIARRLGGWGARTGVEE